MLILYIIYLSKFQLDLLMPHQLPHSFRPTDYLYHEELPLFVDICRTHLTFDVHKWVEGRPPVTAADLCSKPIRGAAFGCRPVEDIGFGSFRHCPGIQSCAKHLGVSENGVYPNHGINHQALGYIFRHSHLKPGVSPVDWCCELEDLLGPRAGHTSLIHDVGMFICWKKGTIQSLSLCTLRMWRP